MTNLCIEMRFVYKVLGKVKKIDTSLNEFSQLNWTQRLGKLSF